MIKTFAAPFALLGALAFAPLAGASMLDTQTRQPNAGTPLYSTYHDGPSGFVFVKLAQGWTFVARDDAAASHAVFHDASTGFVFVKLSSGWKFVPINARA
jgi:hypothetical protein